MRLIYLFSALLFGLTSFTAKAQPKAELSLADSVICLGDLATFTSNSAGIVSYYWMFGDNPQAGFVRTTTNQRGHKYYSSGTFIVTLIVEDALGARDTTAKTIRVKASPSASFSISQSPNAQGVFCISTQFEIQRWSNISGFDSLIWDFGDGTNYFIKYPKHVYATPGNYTIKLKAYSMCGIDSSTRTIEVVSDKRGVPNLSLYINNAVVCLGEKIGIQASTYQEPFSDFMVYTGDGNSTKLDEFNYAYSKTGTYEVMAVGTNSCGNDTAYANAKVVDEIDKRPFVSTDQSLCAMRPARISVGTHTGSYDTAFVDFGDGDTAIATKTYKTLMHTYTTAGNYTVTVRYTYLACSSPDTIDLQIKVDTTLMVYPFHLNASKSTACPNEDIHVFGPSMGIGDTLILNFGDGVVKKYADARPTIVHKYATPGSYQMKAYRKTVCGPKVQLDSSSFSIMIRSDLKHGLTINTNYNANEDLSCAGDSLTISLSGEADYKNPRILLPNGIVIHNWGHKGVFQDVGSYLILAYAENFCGLPMAAAHTIEVTDKMLTPSIDGYHYPRTACVNGDFFFDIFTSNTTKLLWDFGDGTTRVGDGAPHTMYAYNKAGTYDITITATNGCGVTVSKKKAYVEPGPMVDFTLSKESINKGDTLKVTNKTTGQVSHMWIFNNDENDTSSMWDLNKVYSMNGQHTISLFAINEFECWDTLSKFVKVGQIGIFDPKTQEQIFSAYPNPSTGLINVQMKQAKKADLSLYDLSGRLHYSVDLPASSANFEVDVKHLPRGMYILKLNTGESMYSRRIMLIH
jgi:PKD repeat protein